MRFGINNPAWLQAASAVGGEKFFYFMSREDGNQISFEDTYLGEKSDQMEYSFDGVEWEQLNSDDSFGLDNGDKIYIRCASGNIVYDDEAECNLVSFDDHFDVGGDLFTLVYSEPNYKEHADFNSLFMGQDLLLSAKNLKVQTNLSNKLNSLFAGCSNLLEAPKLPATTLTEYCYTNLFSGCTSLITAPELPAMSLAPECYSSMFEGCTSLTNVPELPAMSLFDRCYSRTFSGCTSLITAPELPAMSLAPECYSSMFEGCTSLITAPELPAMLLTTDCYSFMFYGCTSLTNVPELPATSAQANCYSGMFSNCTSLMASPIINLQAFNATGCVTRMFFGCSSLSHVTSLTGFPNSSNSNSWLSGVSATGEFVTYSRYIDEWTRDANGIPTGWTIVEP